MNILFLITKSEYSVFLKYIKHTALAFSMLFFIPTTYAQSQDELCYDLPHGENKLGSVNSVYIPHLNIAESWYTQVYVTNVSRKALNIKLSFDLANGEPYSFPDVVYQGQFSVENSPIQIDKGGAILRPGKTGLIILADNSSPGPVIGKLLWQADACLKSAVVATLRNTHALPMRYEQGLYPLNGGKPF